MYQYIFTDKVLKINIMKNVLLEWIYLMLLILTILLYKKLLKTRITNKS